MRTPKIKTADHADAVYRPPRPVAVAHLRSRPAAAAALWSHKKMGNTFWQRQSGCGSSSPLGESDALPCLRGLCSFPHLSKAYNTFILNLSEALNANSFRVFRWLSCSFPFRGFRVLFAARCEATQGVSKLEELAIRVVFAGEICSLRDSPKTMSPYH